VSHEQQILAGGQGIGQMVGRGGKRKARKQAKPD
jgi:hypothetical protein